MAMTNVNIDLGKPVGKDESCCSASTGETKYYPSFTFTDEDDKFEDAPKEGRMVVKYVIRRSVEINEEDGTERCDYDIEVQKIVSVDGVVKPPAGNNGDKAGDALDALAAALQARHEAGEAESENEGY